MHSLKLVAAVMFLAVEAVMASLAVLYFLVGNISAGVFAAGICFYTVFLAVLAILAYFYTKGVWLRLFLMEKQIYSISSISTDAVFFVDEDFNVTSWSLGAAKIFGYTQEETVGRTSRLLVPDGLLDTDEAASEFRKRGAITDHPITAKRKSGETFHAELSMSSVFLPDGKCEGSVVVLRDVSERRAMQARLSESEERYRNLFESSLDGILAIDSNGRIVECNQAFLSLTGYTARELESLTYSDITPQEWQAIDEDMMENQLLNTGHTDEYVKEFLRKDGSVLPVNLRAWLIRDSEGNPAGAWMIARDISQQKQYERFIRDTIIRLEQANERLREIDRLKTEFVAMVTHELRGPLGTIDSSLGTLRFLLGQPLTQEMLDLLAILDRGVKRLSRLIDDFLDINRIDTGQLKLRISSVDAVSLARDVVDSFSGRFAEKGVPLILEAPRGTCTAECDPSRIEQVLTNLVDNALKYTGDGGVRVMVDHTTNRVLYSVSDCGPGLPPELHPRVFEKFFTARVPGEDDKENIGLGLAISKGIVEAHGGRIWVESRQGEGATFTFEIPRSPEL